MKFVVLLLCMLMVSSMALPHARVKKGKLKKLHGGATNGGFNDNLDLVYESEEPNGEIKLEKIHMERQNIDVSRGKHGKKVMVYANERAIAQEECTSQAGKEEKCITFAYIKTNENGLYIRSNKEGALIIKKQGGEFSKEEVPDAENPKHNVESTNSERRRGASAVTGRKKRAAIYYDLLGSRAIKTIMFVDKAMLNMFEEFNNFDTAEAKIDVEQYLRLVSNEMSMHYQTLRNYNNYNMNISNQVVPMDLVVQLVHVEFPPTSNDFSFQTNTIDGDTLLIEKTQTGTNQNTFSTIRSILIDFKNHVQSYSAPVPFDVALLMTGYDLRTRTNYLDGTVTSSSLLGIAWQGTICRSDYTNAGYHSSIVELDEYMARTASHEMGHGLGMPHDTTSCAVPSTSYTYVMSGTIFDPVDGTASTYSNFSECSAHGVQSTNTLINNINKWRSGCLLPQSESDEFKTQFCEGFPGNVSSNFELTFDEICAIEWGSGSYRATESSSLKEQRLAAGYVEQCVAANSNYPFRCTLSSASTYNMFVAPPGTKCINPNNPNAAMDPDYVCFRGECRYKLDICSTCQCTSKGCCRNTMNPDGTCCTGCYLDTSKRSPACALL